MSGHPWFLSCFNIYHFAPLLRWRVSIISPYQSIILYGYWWCSTCRTSSLVLCHNVSHAYSSRVLVMLAMDCWCQYIDIIHQKTAETLFAVSANFMKRKLPSPQFLSPATNSILEITHPALVRAWIQKVTDFLFIGLNNCWLWLVTLYTPSKRSRKQLD